MNKPIVKTNSKPKYKIVLKKTVVKPKPKPMNKRSPVGKDKYAV